MANVRKKPTTDDEYWRWLLRRFKCQDLNSLRNRYNSDAIRAKSDIEEGSLWKALHRSLLEWSDEYLSNNGVRLFSGNPADSLNLQRKTFESFLLKTRRHNVLDNPHWPDEPADGFIHPGNWMFEVNDIVRTIFVVKYMDGVSFLEEKMLSLFHEAGFEGHTEYKAKMSGYYAAHVYLRHPAEIFRSDFDTEPCDLSVELQIATQLQDVLRGLTHEYYEKRRVTSGDDTAKWQWDHTNEEFLPNYLGHMLQGIEGMIMELRDRSRRNAL